MFEPSNVPSRILPGIRPELIEAPLFYTVWQVTPGTRGPNLFVSEQCLCHPVPLGSKIHLKQLLTLQKLPAQHRAPLLAQVSS